MSTHSGLKCCDTPLCPIFLLKSSKRPLKLEDNTHHLLVLPSPVTLRTLWGTAPQPSQHLSSPHVSSPFLSPNPVYPRILLNPTYPGQRHQIAHSYPCGSRKPALYFLLSSQNKVQGIALTLGPQLTLSPLCPIHSTLAIGPPSWSSMSPAYGHGAEFLKGSPDLCRVHSHSVKWSPLPHNGNGLLGPFTIPPIFVPSPSSQHPLSGSL